MNYRCFNICVVIFLFLNTSSSKAQVFQVDTLKFSGDINKCINLVIMGDGYTASEQLNFITDAINTKDYIFNIEPFSNYSNYFNVFAIRVESAQSGATHPNTAPDCPGGMGSTSVNTYFGCSFDIGNIHRLITPTNYTAVMNVLAANFPAYDQVIIISNTTVYGGSGGAFATTTRHTSSLEVTAHELGHSFASLADEYYAGDNYASERHNMTQQTNPLLVKWKNWMGINNTGIYQHCCSGNSAFWYKPHQSCKMQSLFNDFCSVCKQAIIEKIHNVTDPVVSFTPSASVINSTDQYLDFSIDEFLIPLPNTLKREWVLNGNTIAMNDDSIIIDQLTLLQGINYLSATVTDTVNMVNVDNHETLHFTTINWEINRTITGIEISAGEEFQFDFKTWPNPVAGTLDIKISTESKADISVEIFTSAGLFIGKPDLVQSSNEEILYTYNTTELAPGFYFVLMYHNGARFSKPFLKVN